MSRRNQLRREAAQVRGRIDFRALLIRQRIDSLMHQVRVLARSPAALPVAFVCGMLAEWLLVPGTKRTYRVLVGLAGPSKALHLQALQIAAGLIGSAVLARQPAHCSRGGGPAAST